MQQSRESQRDELGFGAWLGFWVRLGVLAFLAVVGAFFASADAYPGDDVCGLVLSVAALALAFLCIKARFDGAASDWANALLVDDLTNLTAIIVILTLLGLAGIIAAASVDAGGLYAGGIALFATSAIGVLLNIKHVFDKLERRG